MHGVFACMFESMVAHVNKLRATTLWISVLARPKCFRLQPSVSFCDQGFFSHVGIRLLLSSAR